MPLRRLACVISLLVIGLFCKASAGVQDPALSDDSEAVARRWCDLALTIDCEEGFRRFIRMAQTGQLGDDVTNANIGVFKNHARVELVRTEAPKKLLLLTPKSSTQTTSRYFNVEAGEGATASDVSRVTKALDEAFEEDPFQLAYDFFNASPGGDPLPNLAEAWRYGGWRGVLRVLERRMVTLASVRYSIVVIVALATALVGSLVLLWGSTPPRSTAESSTDSQSGRERSVLQR